jgi:hypothetical protein
METFVAGQSVPILNYVPLGIASFESPANIAASELSSDMQSPAASLNAADLGAQAASSVMGDSRSLENGTEEAIQCELNWVSTLVDREANHYMPTEIEKFSNELSESMLSESTQVAELDLSWLNRDRERSALDQIFANFL